MNRIKDKEKTKRNNRKSKKPKTTKKPRTTVQTVTTRRRFGFVPILHLTNAPLTTTSSNLDETSPQPLHHVVALVAEKAARTLDVSTNAESEELGSGHGEHEIVVTMVG